MTYVLDGGVARMCIGFATTFFLMVGFIGLGYVIGHTITWITKK